MFNWGNRIKQLELTVMRLITNIASLESRITKLELANKKQTNVFNPDEPRKPEKMAALTYKDLPGVSRRMKCLGMSVAQLADETGYGEGTIKSILRGYDSVAASIKMQLRLAKALKCTVEDLRKGLNDD